MYQTMLALHLVAATIWTGGHLVLSLAILPKVIKEKDVSFLKTFESLYERVGIPSLVIQIVTGFYLADRVTNGFAEWFDFSNHVGSHIGFKMILLVMTFMFAVHARLFIVPKLEEENLVLMAVHILGVTILSVLFVLTGVSFRVGGFF